MSWGRRADVVAPCSPISRMPRFCVAVFSLMVGHADTRRHASDAQPGDVAAVLAGLSLASPPLSRGASSSSSVAGTAAATAAGSGARATAAAGASSLPSTSAASRGGDVGRSIGSGSGSADVGVGSHRLPLDSGVRRVLVRSPGSAPLAFRHLVLGLTAVEAAALRYRLTPRCHAVCCLQRPAADKRCP